jgi:phosphatidylethanolamine-binding protein (PEBP) family uncharacterized protein
MRRVTLATAFLMGLCATALGADPVFTLVSPDLPPGKPVPERFTANAFGCHGPNESPALKWSNAPAGTKSFAVTMFDPYRPPAGGTGWCMTFPRRPRSCLAKPVTPVAPVCRRKLDR